MSTAHHLITNNWFGLDLEEVIKNYMHDEFMPMYRDSYEAVRGFAGWIADTHCLQSMTLNKGEWFDNGVHQINFWTPDSDEAEVCELGDNVIGKAHFSQRTGLDSIEAGRPGNLHLIRFGDFPYGGYLVNYRGFTAGGSGTKQESDIHLVMLIIDHLCKAMNAHMATVKAAIEHARGLSKTYPDLNIGSCKFFAGSTDEMAALVKVYKMGSLTNSPMCARRYIEYLAKARVSNTNNNSVIGPDGAPNIAVSDGEGNALNPKQAASKRAAEAREGMGGDPNYVEYDIKAGGS